jgi:hypothetical protein
MDLNISKIVGIEEFSDEDNDDVVENILNSS